MKTHLEMLSYAVQSAAGSPCQSKRGAVIWDEHGIISIGCNAQVRPFMCDSSDRCKETCRLTAIHAEQAAILNSATALGVREAALRVQPGATQQILHVKVINGEPVPTGGPSCVQCSKLILAAGITGIWLLLDEGWKFYNAAEFHILSMIACGKKPPFYGLSPLAEAMKVTELTERDFR